MTAIPKDDVIRSQKYLRGSQGQPCAFRGPTCNRDPETTVPAHLNGAAFGKGAGHKAHDIAVLDACSDCHAYIDVGHGTKPLMTDAEFYAALLAGVIRTIVSRARRQIIIVPMDAERLSSDRPRKGGPSRSRPVHSGPPLKSANRLPKKGEARFPSSRAKAST